MSEEIGKIEKPPVDDFKNERKLFYVPLIGVMMESNEEFAVIYRQFWTEVESQLFSLEQKLGDCRRVYHEFLLSGGEEGLKIVRELNADSARVIDRRVENGAGRNPGLHFRRCAEVIAVPAGKQRLGLYQGAHPDHVPLDLLQGPAGELVQEVLFLVELDDHIPLSFHWGRAEEIPLTGGLRDPAPPLLPGRQPMARSLRAAMSSR